MTYTDHQQLSPTGGREPSLLHTTIFELVAGWAAFVTGLVPTYPIKTVRVRYMSLGQSPMWTLRHDTFLGLYGGFTTPLFLSGPVMAVVFCANERFKSLLAGRLSLDRWWGGEAGLGGGDGTPGCNALLVPSLAERALAGGLAGAAGSTLSSPVSTLRIQQQNLSRCVSGIRGGSAASVGGGSGSEQRFTTRREVVNCFIQNGTFFSGLWRAWPLEATFHFFGRMLFFTSYEYYKSLLLSSDSRSPRDQKHLLGDGSAASPQRWCITHDSSDDVGMEWGKRVVAAVGASASSWTVVYPIEVIKTKMQADSWQPSQRKFSSILHCVSSTYKLQGLAGFWRGCPVSVVDYALHSAICLPTFDLLKRWHCEKMKSA